jgi:hypothetical protein
VIVSAVARVAATELPTSALPPGEYYHFLVRSNRNVVVDGPVIHDSDREYWVAADGSGLARESVTRSLYPGQACPPAPPTPAGYLSVTCAPAGDMIVTDMQFGPGGFESVYDDGILAWVTSLPTDQAALEAALQQQWAKEYANSPTPVGNADSAQLLGLIGNALADPITSPAVRSSLYRLAGTLPGVSVQTAVTDDHGRTGTAITVTGSTGVPGPPNPAASSAVTKIIRKDESTPTETTRLIFDPATAAILDEDTTIPDPGHNAAVLLRSSLAFFDQGVVGSLPTGHDQTNP